MSPTVVVRQATVNYWLAKLAPVLIALVDTESGTIWYDWLDNSYEAYPKQRDFNGSVTLRLGKTTSVEPLPEGILQYAARYYGQMGITSTNLAQRARLLEMLFHVVNMTHSFYDIWFYVEGIPSGHEATKDILERLREFLQEFALHDTYLQNRWHAFRCTELVAVPVIEAFGSHFVSYDEIKKTFFVPDASADQYDSVPLLGSHHDPGGTLVFMPLRFRELLSAIGPAIRVLRDIETLIFRLLLLGRLQSV